uniref:AAA+ ATPase domain-containing protein n=1 Tax=viral metagenome TaxID=1070528 RepID=A0A6C0EQ21_9ZZZZ
MNINISSFISSLQNNYTNVTKMAIFNYFKTGNTIIDAILSTVMISLFGIIINNIYDTKLDELINNFSINNIKSLFYKKNCIIIEGKKSSFMCKYNSNYTISAAYSLRFKAIWEYIINNIDKNDTINQIKESHTSYKKYNSCLHRHNTETEDIFIVCQKTDFKIDNNIYVNTVIEQETAEAEKDKKTTTTDKIIIKIYSYYYSLSYLKKYVNDITFNYSTSLKNSRNNKKFIYILDKVNCDSEESKFSCWVEDIFESSRSVNNIFFDGKRDLFAKIDFFINNRDWYYEKGIPYSLGIGLHGPPGTGKTSLIKALSNYTQRHLIVLSLKLIKTKRHLEQFFFESTYNDENEKGSITFDKKIIVFEDIDCIGDIILNRSETSNKNRNAISNKKNIKIENNKVNINDVIQTICDVNDSGMNIVGTSNMKQVVSPEDQPITLDDILNLWDGIRETPGRILIISSNHYEKLDPALIRPGRIDITHELSNASHNTISEIYFHLFNTKIDNKILKKIKEFFYSPAEIINIYISSNKNEEKFIQRLLLNKKV